MSIKSYLPRHPLIPSKAHSEAQKMPEVVDQILERSTVLLTCSAETLFDIVPDFANLRHIFLEKLAKTLPWRVRT